MSKESRLKTLLDAWESNLEAPEEDYDEELSDSLITSIEELSPEAYEKIKEDSGYNDIVG